MEGVGHLHRVEGRFAPRLTVLHGPNESGKTTLLNFIRKILFYRKSEFLPGVSGHLLVSMDDGRTLRLESTRRKHLIGDGSVMTPLRENFLPVGIGVFERIFAVGLDDLQSPRHFDDDEVQDRFFSAEAGLGALSLARFLTRMETLEKELCVPGDRSGGLLNRIFDEIRANEEEIAAWQRENGRLLEAEKELKARRVALGETRRQLSEARQKRAFLDVITRARPLWLEIRETESALSQIPLPPGPIPPDGLLRLEDLVSRVKTLRERVKELRRKEKQERLRCSQMSNSPLMSLLTYREELESLEGEKEKILRITGEIPPLEMEVSEKETLLKLALRTFAPHWSETDLAEADLSLVSEQKARQYEENRKSLLERKYALLRELESEAERRRTLEMELRLALDRMKEPETASEVFQKRRDLFFVIRGDLLHNDAVYQEIRGEKIRLEAIEEEMQIDANPPVFRKPWVPALLLVFLVFLAGVAVVLGYLEPRLRPWNFYGAGFFMLTALAPVLLIFGEKREHLKQVNQWEERYERRCETIEHIEDDIESLRLEMRSVAASIEENSKILGIRVPSSLDGLDAVFETLEEERSLLRRHQDLTEESERLSQALVESEGRRESFENDLSLLEKEFRAWEEEWRTWLRSGRFNEELTPETFLSFLSQAQEAVKDLQTLQEVRNRLAERRKYAEEANARTGALGRKMGLDLDEETFPVVLHSLKEALEMKLRLEEASGTLQLIGEEKVQAEKELDTLEKALRKLCDDAGAEDEVAFRVFAGQSAQRQTLEARLSEAKRLLQGITGGEGAIEPAWEREFLASATDQVSEMEQLRLQAENFEDMLKELSGSCSAMEKRLADTAMNERLFDLRQKNEILRFRSREVFREWISVILTRHFTEKARERHEKNRHPTVTRQAENILADILGTDAGRWGMLFSSEGPESASDSEKENDLLLERQTGIKLNENVWSSGLADQVWLSLRLAMAARQAEISESIPVVLDDILVRFDEERQRGALEALWKLSEGLQVILLTCHRSTAEMFRSRLEKEKGFALIELDSGRSRERTVPLRRVRRAKTKRRPE